VFFPKDFYPLGFVLVRRMAALISGSLHFIFFFEGYSFPSPYSLVLQSDVEYVPVPGVKDLGLRTGHGRRLVSDFLSFLGFLRVFSQEFFPLFLYTFRLFRIFFTLPAWRVGTTPQLSPHFPRQHFPFCGVFRIRTFILSFHSSFVFWFRRSGWTSLERLRRERIAV